MLPHSSAAAWRMVSEASLETPGRESHEGWNRRGSTARLGILPSSLSPPPHFLLHRQRWSVSTAVCSGGLCSSRRIPHMTRPFQNVCRLSNCRNPWPMPCFPHRIQEWCCKRVFRERRENKSVKAACIFTRTLKLVVLDTVPLNNPQIQLMNEHLHVGCHPQGWAKTKFSHLVVFLVLFSMLRQKRT